MPDDPDTSPAEYMLTFGGTPVGLRCHSIGSPQIRLATEPKVIHPFWHKQVIIDGRYPAAVFEHSFQVVVDGGTAVGYVGSVYAFDTFFERSDVSPTTARTLLLTTVVGTTTPGDPVLSFGLCNISGVSQVEPSDVLVNKFGLLEVRFLGNTTPTLIE